MPILRSQIETALDELISNLEWGKFQGLAVVLAKLRWPDLIATERQKDGGADAVVRAQHAADGVGKALCCSLTADIGKVRGDAIAVKENYQDINLIIYATPSKATYEKQASQNWSKEINSYGFDLLVISREEIITQLMTPANASICSSHLNLAFTLEPTIEESITLIRDAANQVSQNWSNRTRGQPLIELRARRLGDGGVDTEAVLELSELNSLLLECRRIILDAPAGRGKTTTLIQLATQCSPPSAIGVLIDLSAWIRSRLPILQFIAGLPQFQARDIAAPLLARAIEHVRFVFILNGWNEISESESSGAEGALKELERSFPTAGIIVATRSQNVLPPLPGAIRLRLLPLTRAERSDYLIRRLSGRAAELRTTIERDPNIDDLSRTPLILASFCKLFEAQCSIPRTRLRVFGEVVRLMADAEEHRPSLQRAPLQGHSEHYLSDLAVAMTARGEVLTDDARARESMFASGEALRRTHRISNVPEPGALLDALCQHHLLERHEYPTLRFGFEHQQFQEYYAALCARARLRAIQPPGDVNLAADFTGAIVNQPSWAVPLEMIAEYIGESLQDNPEDEDALAIGERLVETALRVDPVFSADLTRRCGPSLWPRVENVIATTLRDWLAVPEYHHQKCAIAGMLATGSHDFYEVIESQLSSTDQQVRLGLYRTGDGVHLSSLGECWQQAVRSWIEDARVDFVSEMLHYQRDVDSVMRFAMGDSSSSVKQSAIDAFAWIGSPEDIEEFLSALPPEDFGPAVRSLPVELIPSSKHPDALLVCETLERNATDPEYRLRALLLLGDLGGAISLESLKGAVDSLNVETVRQASDLLSLALTRIQVEDRVWVTQWVLARLIDGSLRAEPWTRFVTNLPIAERDRLVSQLEASPLALSKEAVISVIAAAGESSVARRIFLKLVDLSGESTRRRADYEVQQQLEEMFRAFAPDVAVVGISLTLASGPNLAELCVLAHLFSIRGNEDKDLRKEMSPNLREQLRGYFKRGITLILAQADYDGRQKCELATALARVGSADDMADLRALIRADIERIRRGSETWRRGDRGEMAQGSAMRHSIWYMKAVLELDKQSADALLLELLDDHEYEADAAAALVQLASLEIPRTGFGGESELSLIQCAREGRPARRLDEARRPRFAAAIRSRVEQLLDVDASQREAEYAWSRAKVLAKSLAELDAADSVPLVLRAASVPERWGAWKQLDVIDALLFARARLPAESIVAIVDQIAAQLREHQYSSQETWLQQRIIRALAFVEPPAIGIARVREFVTEFRISGSGLRGLVSALGVAGSTEAFLLLRGLAPDACRDELLGDTWVKAVSRFNTTEARELLMSFVDTSTRGQSGFRLSSENALAECIAQIATQDPPIEQRIFDLCETRDANRELLASIICRLHTSRAVSAGLKLIDDSVTPPIPRGVMDQIENAFVEKRPYKERAYTYTLHGRSANEIRAALFEMCSSDERRKGSAFALLGQIECWRLEHGRPFGEPRHPNHSSGRPWPVPRIAST